MGRSDAVKSAKTRWHADRSAGVGPQGRIAETLGHRRGRARRGSAGRALRRPRIERRTVEGILAEDAEGHLVGDGLADQGRPRIEQPPHCPRVARRKGMLPSPVRVATAGRMPGHVKEILGGKRQAGKRPPRCTHDPKQRTGNERAGQWRSLAGPSGCVKALTGIPRAPGPVCERRQGLRRGFGCPIPRDKRGARWAEFHVLTSITTLM